MGDGVLAYFGWPKAHEDEAERAVRAALVIVQAVGQVTAAGERIAARIGIATGLVVVGDRMGQGAARERAVSGETPNLAARLLTLAPPGGIVIPPRHSVWSAASSTSRTSGSSPSRGLPSRCAPGGCSASARPKAASRHAARL